MRRGNPLEGEEAREALETQPPRHARALKQRADLGSDREDVGARVVVEWLLADAVSRQRQSSPRRVPDGEGEHAVECAETVLAGLLVRVDDHLGVGVRPKAVAPFFEAAPQLAEVIDLAVEGRPHGAILVGDRLGSTGHVDDGEPPHAERNVAVDIEPFAIGAAMSERGRHLPDAFQIAVAACGLEQPRNAAHQLPSASGDAWPRRISSVRALTGDIGRKVLARANDPDIDAAATDEGGGVDGDPGSHDGLDVVIRFRVVQAVRPRLARAGVHEGSEDHEADEGTISPRATSMTSMLLEGRKADKVPAGGYNRGRTEARGGPTWNSSTRRRPRC